MDWCSLPADKAALKVDLPFAVVEIQSVTAPGPARDEVLVSPDSADTQLSQEVIGHIPIAL